MKKRNFLALLVISVMMIAFSGCHKKSEKRVKPNKAKSSVQKNIPYQGEVRTVKIRSAYVLGNPNAKVVVVEFTDFQCPFCRRFHHQTFPLIKNNYIDKGKVKWITYNFPLRFHQFAFPAARGFVCAGELGGNDAYWKYYLKIFSVPALNPATPIEIASEIGLDRTKFGKCIESEAVKDKIADSLRYGASLGIRGTPTFIVGRDNGDGTMTGEMIVGAQPYEIFKSKIDALLSE